MLVVVFLLLPVFLTGASLELPGAGCGTHHCCALVPCMGHAHVAEQGKKAAHDHHHPAHERIMLLCDAGQRSDRGALQATMPAQSSMTIGVVHRLWQALQMPGEPRVLFSYTGFLSPLRC